MDEKSFEACSDSLIKAMDAIDRILANIEDDNGQEVEDLKQHLKTIYDRVGAQP